MRGTFTSVDSRVRTVADGYLGDLRAGDRMLAVPARTASLGASWVSARMVDGAHRDACRSTGSTTTASRSRARTRARDGAEQRAVTGWRLRNFWRPYDGDTHLRLSASRDVGRGLELLLIGDNLLGGQLGEPDNLTIRQGRTISGGLRASF